MRREDLIAFAARDWVAVERAKEQHWLGQKTALPDTDLWRRSDDLLQHARNGGRERDPGDRLADLQVHYFVGLALRAVTRATR